jgi:membrane protease subunit HflC
MQRPAIFVAAAVALIVVVFSSVFIVDEREKVLVVQFGEVKAVKEEPGLGFKIPFIQEVVTMGAFWD